MYQQKSYGETIQQLVPRLDWKTLDGPEHLVQFYESDAFLQECVAGFMNAAFAAGDSCVVIATEDHIARFEERLCSFGCDIAALRASRQLVTRDAANVLSEVMLNGSPKPDLFEEVIGGIIKQAAKSARRLRIFGEMVTLLWMAGLQDAAMQIEQLWNRLREEHQFLLFCAYPVDCFRGHARINSLNALCDQHTLVIPSETYSALDDPEDRLRAVVLLQHKAWALEDEITERKKIEKLLRSSEARYRSLFQSAHDGILIVDPDSGKILDANPSAARLLGCQREELPGKELWETGLFSSRVEMLESLRELRGGEKARYEQVQIGGESAGNLELEFSNSLYEADDQRIVQCTVRDITERRRAEEVSSHLAAIVESSDDAIVSKSLEGIIMSWNNGATRIFGYTAEEAIGKSIYMLIPPERTDEEPIVLDKLRRGERVDHFETVRLTKDGRRVDVSLTVSPVRNWSGKIIGASKIARDITERKHSEMEREALLAREQAARAEAEKANRAKDEFLALVSHELRTPLNAILGWIWMARSGNLDKGTIDHALQTIERNARTQAKLIEDLLDISRITTGKLRLDLRPLDAAEVVLEAVNAIRPGADAKGIQLRLDLQRDPGRVLGDAARLQQILSNLLTNAVKFTSAGGRILIGLTRTDSQVEIKVSDTGQGIEPEFLPYVFERFRQADGTLTRKHGGLGLGLAIVQHLVAFHGGSVRADSRGVGKGATFTVTLPLHRSWEIEQTVSRGINRTSEKLRRGYTPPSSRLQDLRILVVDDDADAREVVTTLLEQHGARVIAVGSASRALEIIDDVKPDILVSDIEMPDEDGYTLIERLRSRESGFQRLIPALALTAHARLEDRLHALSAGYQAHIAKPIEPDQLIATIDGLAGLNREA